ncbi:MAG: hypothetical protein QOF91_2081 [Alphaproteobacteria bacterium]|jgi:hypothetical protein|nr:hypothetical protein [Alphaproteobacteria bacterium]MEA3026796.1 hypothetical protein [Alphaproteobacteria bacterium]
MSSPWEPAIPQAMQRHGGSNRSIPKTVQPKPAEPPVPAVVETPDLEAAAPPEPPAA